MKRALAVVVIAASSLWVLGVAPANANIVCRDIFDGPNVCQQLIDRVCSITPCTQ